MTPFPLRIRVAGEDTGAVAVLVCMGGAVRYDIECAGRGFSGYLMEEVVNQVEAYCRGCGYALRGLEAQGKCPECGRGFDKGCRKTVAARPPRLTLRRWRWRVVGLAVLLMVAASPIVWVYRGWKAEQDHIAAMEAVGFAVKSRRIGPLWMGMLPGERFGYILERAVIVRDGYQLPPGELKITQSQLRHLEGLTQLEDISLNLDEIADEGMSSLSGLVNLKRLRVGSWGGGDDGLAHLAVLTKLEELEISFGLVTDAGMRHLKKLTKLRVLSLRCTKVSGRGLTELKGLKKLEELNLSNTAVTAEGLRQLAGFTQLRSLELDTTKIGDNALEHVAKLTQLRTLGLRETLITTEGVKQIKSWLPAVQIVR